MKGYVQVYTGDGKGKTTAALGLALRAAGAGKKVFIAQFVKGMDYSEHNALKRFDDLITVKQYGKGCFIYNRPTDEDIAFAQKGLKDIQREIADGSYDVVILDEVHIATYYRLITVETVLELIDSKPDNVEFVLTGRNADSRIIEAADLVTEMKEIKHYYASGVDARTGIEK